jgi:hypothetical protein
MSFNFNQDLVLEDERYLRALQKQCEHWKFLNEPETWEYSLVGNGKENLINYIQLAIVARENKTQFP